MLALVGGLGAALVFGVSTLASTRASRLIGAGSTVAWVMLVGLPLAVGAAAFDTTGVTLASLPWLLTAGLSNVLGLGLAYSAVRMGRVGVVAPLVSTEGAIAALVSIVAGGSVSGGLLAALGIVAAGGALTAASADAPSPNSDTLPGGSRPGLSVLLALAAAVAFAAGLYATARIGRSLPLGWAVLAPRVTGSALVAAPLAFRGRLVLTRSAAPLVLVAGVAEVIGFGFIGLGARSDIAVTAVLTSQFSAVAVLGAIVVFGERLSSVQRIGVVAVAVGTALVAAFQPR
jgi:drug/metabolite transporter (DMT)-like permease